MAVARTTLRSSMARLELLRLEALEPRPQADVGRPRLLRLHSRQPADRVHGAELVALEQQLARQRRAAELAAAEDPVRHAAIMPGEVARRRLYIAVERPRQLARIH